jgi:hypothetical protein
MPKVCAAPWASPSKPACARRRRASKPLETAEEERWLAEAAIHPTSGKGFSAKLVVILCCAQATPLSEYQLILRLPRAKLVAHQHQGLLYR